MDRDISSISSSLVFDAHIRLGLKTKVLSHNINPICKKGILGRCYTLKGVSNVTENIKKTSRSFFERIKSGSVIIVDTGCNNIIGHWGELMSHAALQQNVAGVIINGGCRDISQIRNMNFPVFCKYSSPYESGDKYCIGEYEVDINFPDVNGDMISIRHYRDFVIADEDGIVIIDEVNIESVLTEAINIRSRELKTITDIHNGVSINEAFLKNDVV